MSDKLVDDLLSDLKTALDVTPSPGFAAGVRARIADKHARGARARWWPLAATAVLAAAVVVAVVLRSPSSDRVVVDQPPTIAAVSPIAPPPSVVAPPVEPATPVQPITRPALHITRPIAPEIARVSATEPALEVITDQGAVLRNLWARAGVRGVVKEVEAAPADDAKADPTKEIVVPKVTIDPIVISALGGDGAAPAAPTNDRTTIRRSQAGRQ